MASGLAVELLSGDRAGPGHDPGRRSRHRDRRHGCKPADKVARLEALAAQDRQVLMVGDGLNDAPALAAAHVSLSPAIAVDISQTAADAVFQGQRLEPVLTALDVACRARRLVRQNLAMSFGYNMLTVPLAVIGLRHPADRRSRHVGQLDRRRLQRAPPQLAGRCAGGQAGACGRRSRTGRLRPSAALRLNRCAGSPEPSPASHKTSDRDRSPRLAGVHP